MIDTDSSGLRGPDDSEDLRWWQWQARPLVGSLLSDEMPLKATMSGQTCLIGTLTLTYAGYATSIPVHNSPYSSCSCTCCAWPPVAMPPLPPATQATYTHTLTLHALYLNASACPGASETNRGLLDSLCPTCTHTCIHGHILCSHTPERCVHHCVCALNSVAQVIHHTCLQLTIIQSFLASLLWL